MVNTTEFINLIKHDSHSYLDEKFKNVHSCNSTNRMRGSQANVLSVRVAVEKSVRENGYVWRKKLYAFTQRCCFVEAH